MRIGIPIEEDRGHRSPVCDHFGAAPAFLIIDTDRGTYEALPNAHGHEVHGQCVPVDLIRDQRLDVMLVSGLGRGAMMKLRALGVRICRTASATAGEGVAAFLANSAADLDFDSACAGHEHGHGH